MPRVPPAASDPTTSRSLYPRVWNVGRATRLMVAAVEILDPEQAAKMAQETMLVWSNPPGIGATQRSRARYMRSAMPLRSTKFTHQDEQREWRPEETCYRFPRRGWTLCSTAARLSKSSRQQQGQGAQRTGHVQARHEEDGHQDESYGNYQCCTILRTQLVTESERAWPPVAIRRSVPYGAGAGALPSCTHSFNGPEIAERVQRSAAVFPVQLRSLRPLTRRASAASALNFRGQECSGLTYH